MRNISSAKLLIIFAIAFSLTTLSPSLGGHLPSINPARATPLTSHVQWYPAGPVTDTLSYSIFADETTEFQALQAHTIDFTDWPLSPDLIASFSSDPTLFVSQTIPDTGYFELQFNQGNNYWNCQFNYGNPATQSAPLTTDCGKNIRQAFAHALDKNSFITVELQGHATPIDNPVPPPSIDLNTPDPCAYDQLFPQTGSACTVNALGGTAYHLASATNCGLTPASLCTSLPGFAYTPGMGTPDFCAAADHLIAAGLATGKNGGPGTGTCVLTGVQLSTITAHPVEIFVRSDNTPRLHAGQSYAQFFCALFTGTFSTGCGNPGPTQNIVKYTPGSITAFQGFTTPIGSTNLLWWVYTAGFGNVLTFDSSLFLGYNSQFVSGYAGIQKPTVGAHCNAAAKGSFAPGNYMYICNEDYDTLSSNGEFAQCLSAPGDPTNGQINDTAGNTVTFGSCGGGLSAASAMYQAQYVYGKNAYSIPWWSGQNVFAYQNTWDRGALNAGDGFTPPGNFFTTLDARQSSGTPRTCGGLNCLVQGYKQTTGSINPFIGSTVWDAGVIGSIWDAPGSANPDVPSSYMEWMTLGTTQIPAAQLGYAVPTGTTFAFRYQLRHDIFWQFAKQTGTCSSSNINACPGSLGAPVTAWDIAFSYIAGRANGVFGGLAPMTGVHVVSPSQIDILVSKVGPNTKFFLSNTVIPGRSWTAGCTAAQWDAAVNQGLAATSPAGIHAADVAITQTNACIAPSSAVTTLANNAGFVIQPSASSVDSAKVAPSYDVDVAANAIGSGPWVCESAGTIGGPGCSSSNNSAPAVGGSWTFVRYGQGLAPGASLDTYFRSNGNLALWIWSQNTGDPTQDGTNFSILASCVGVTPVPTKCLGWAQGIGNASGTSTTPALITGTQVSIVFRFQGINWVSPNNWRNLPPQNIGTFPPVLYEGSNTLNPSTVSACTSAYPAGGYDC